MREDDEGIIPHYPPTDVNYLLYVLLPVRVQGTSSVDISGMSHSELAPFPLEPSTPKLGEPKLFGMIPMRAYIPTARVGFSPLKPYHVSVKKRAYCLGPLVWHRLGFGIPIVYFRTGPLERSQSFTAGEALIGLCIPPASGYLGRGILDFSYSAEGLLFDRAC